jgi:hypothetical protein
VDTGNVTITVVQMTWFGWIIYLVVAMIGGLASNLINSKGTMKRICLGEDKKCIEMGPLPDIIAGIAASLGILWAMTPQTLMQLIGMGAIAGYGGSAILQALVNRLVADVSQKEKETLSEINNNLKKTTQELEEKNLAIVQKEKQLDSDKALVSIMEKIAAAKNLVTGG